jgi:alkanesulfonate monooxygenase SsuD/methylene tetrahydromethanopterin reductase-like flavin-dependent oxidoreductase (luciferase family)
MSMSLELGLDTFGDVTTGHDGHPLPHAEVIRHVIDEAVLADDLGIDFFGVGEHHRADFAVSSPEVLLAAIAGRTKRIRLGSAVTVLSSDDPIRVFQRFATLDAVSNGRAEVILGRGSFTESFPLFGFNLSDYEKLFEEKLDLFAVLIQQEPVSWQGTTRYAAGQSARVSADRNWTSNDLDRGRRQPGIRSARGPI